MTNQAFTEKDFGDKSFLRLAGGKQKLVSKLISLLPTSIKQGRYIEPFFGGGSLFFAISPESARLNDANLLLMDMYRFIRDDPGVVHHELIKLAKKHGESFYYKVRSEINHASPSHKKAAQMIYLNRSCFNGVFRVNKKSEFNVPWGKKSEIIIPSRVTLENTAHKFSACNLLSGDFSEALQDIQPQDFVYLDPPYLPLDQTAFFRHFTWPRFELDDHKRLAVCAQRIREQGARVMVSNPDLPIVRSIFNNWHFTEVSLPRSAAARKTNVRRAAELIITSYDMSEEKH